MAVVHHTLATFPDISTTCGVFPNRTNPMQKTEITSLVTCRACCYQLVRITHDVEILKQVFPEPTNYNSIEYPVKKI